MAPAVLLPMLQRREGGREPLSIPGHKSTAWSVPPLYGQFSGLVQKVLWQAILASRATWGLAGLGAPYVQMQLSIIKVLLSFTVNHTKVGISN